MLPVACACLVDGTRWGTGVSDVMCTARPSTARPPLSPGFLRALNSMVTAPPLPSQRHFGCRNRPLQEMPPHVVRLQTPPRVRSKVVIVIPVGVQVKLMMDPLVLAFRRCSR